MTNSRDWLNPANWATPRWKTAIKRPMLSLPVRNAIASNQLPSLGDWLDIGCGHGQDVNRLTWHNAVGFDPYYRPKFELLDATYPITSLIYVLNVIESDDDRDRTLQLSFSLPRRLSNTYLTLPVTTFHL